MTSAKNECDWNWKENVDEKDDQKSVLHVRHTITYRIIWFILMKIIEMTNVYTLIIVINKIRSDCEFEEYLEFISLLLIQTTRHSFPIKNLHCTSL